MRRFPGKRHEGTVRGDGNVSILIRICITEVYQFVKIIQLNFVHFKAYTVYLIKKRKEPQKNNEIS